ncbi:hypothetical protein Tco_0875516 [Tanacetum coccineum]|uniref:Reverse transcriptase domain-containing protein n=1 Tax=Tanacetum coccineum TaxID=301880 RepID=A0ABQ5BPN9_9ASTR
MQQPIINPEDISDPITAMNMALVLIAKAFKLNYSTPTNNNKRISSNSRNRQIAQLGMNLGQDRQMLDGYRLRRRNIRVPYDQINNPPQHPRIVYPPVLNINYFRHFLDILRNYDLMDDEPMWAADHVVAPTSGSAITIPKTANEFAIKEKQKHGWTNSAKELSKHGMNFKPLSLAISFPPALFDRLLEEIRAFSQHKNESLTDAWLRMKEMLRNSHGYNMSKGNIMKIFYHGLSKITQEVLNAAAGGIFLYKTPNQAYQLLEDKKRSWILKLNSKPLPKIIKLQFNTLKPSLTDLLTSNLVDLLDLFPVTLNQTQWHNQRSTNHSIYNEHVNAVFTRSGKSYNPPVNSNDQQTNPENPINFDNSDEEDEEPTPQPKILNLKPVKETTLPKPYKPKIPYPQRLRKEKWKLNKNMIPRKKPSFLPVIISSQLSKEKKNKLIYVLKKHKQAFAWKTTDIPGICPSFCKHKIQLLDDKKLVVQKQRSPWVSPIYCVPKKGGITVVTNENNELVPTRTVTGLEVDKAKINVISKLPPPTNIKGVRSFLGHAGFYRRFIKDFSKIARPITKLLEKDTPFEFNDECQIAFGII